MSVSSEIISQDNWASPWQPRIIENIFLDESFGYEVVMVRLDKPSERWWQRAKNWLLPPEPVSISQVLPLKEAILVATKFHNKISQWQQPHRNFEVCVRTYDPSE